MSAAARAPFSGGALRRWAGRIALALAAFATLEGLLLLAGFDAQPPPDPFLERFAEGRVDGYALLRVDAEELWVPIPGARVPWGEEHLDAQGFRGAPPARERTALPRWAVLGDSISFGRGVRAGECWVQVALDELAAEGKACEALNAAVIGSTVEQGLERYRRDVRPWKPDVVIAGFGAFEEHLPALGRPDRELIDTRAARAYASESALERLGRDTRCARGLRWACAGFPASSARPESAVPDLEGERFPAGAEDWAGVRRVSPERFRAALVELAREVAADGARLVLLDPARRARVVRSAPVLAAYSRASSEVARELGLELLDGREILGAALAEGLTYQELFGGGPADLAVEGHRRLGRAAARVLSARWPLR